MYDKNQAGQRVIAVSVELQRIARLSAAIWALVSFSALAVAANQSPAQDLGTLKSKIEDFFLEEVKAPVIRAR